MGAVQYELGRRLCHDLPHLPILRVQHAQQLLDPAWVICQIVVEAFIPKVLQHDPVDRRGADDHQGIPILADLGVIRAIGFVVRHESRMLGHIPEHFVVLRRLDEPFNACLRDPLCTVRFGLVPLARDTALRRIEDECEIVAIPDGLLPHTPILLMKHSRLASRAAHAEHRLNLVQRQASDVVRQCAGRRPRVVPNVKARDPRHLARLTTIQRRLESLSVCHLLASVPAKANADAISPPSLLRVNDLRAERVRFSKMLCD